MAITDNLTVEEARELIDRNRKQGWPDLDLGERAFALEYITDYNHRRAARETGWSPDHGLKLIRRPLVVAFIKDLQDKQSISNIVTEDFVRNMWLSILPKLMGDEEVPMVTAQGEQFRANKFHASEVNAALRELAKSTSFYKEEQGGTSAAEALLLMAQKLPGA